MRVRVLLPAPIFTMSNQATVYDTIDHAMGLIEQRLGDVMKEYEAEFAKDDLSDEELSMIAAGFGKVLANMERMVENIAEMGDRLRTGNV